MKVDGKVEGGIGYSSQSGVGGQLTLASAAVKFPQAAARPQIDSAQVQIADGKVVLAPSDIEMEDGQSAQVEGEYALDNERRPSASARNSWRPAPPTCWMPRPFRCIERLHQGSWKGWISYEKTARESAAFGPANTICKMP